jgi:hypothetical protein
MNASNAIKLRVDRFVEEILSLMRRVQEEHRATALRTVMTMLTDLGRPPARASSERRQKGRKGTARTKKSVAAPARGAKQGTLSRAASSRTSTAPATRKTPATSPVSASIPADATSEAVIEPAPSSGDRETVVLDTVRSLVRATATEIATRSGLPNGSVYVSLRALVGRGRIARAETARGVEYSLVSSGEIRPFKRVRAATPTAPTEVEAASVIEAARKEG